MKRRQHGRQRGFSLVELLATITVLTILLGLCAGLIRVLLKLDQSGRDAMVASADAARLARDFRTDAHQGTGSTPPTPAPDRIGWTTTEDARVSYQIRPHDILREATRAGKVVRRELYRLPSRATARFEATTAAGPVLLSIVMDREAHPASGFAAADRIDAEFGRIDRLIARKP